MNKNAKLSYDQIDKDTLWIAKMTYGRFVGTYEDLRMYREDSENLRDIDISCGGQPEHLKEFYEGYFDYFNKYHDHYLIKDYYNDIYLSL